MTHKGIKAALILGPITLAILGFCAWQLGERDKGIDEGRDVGMTEEQAILLLDEKSGNKGYDQWTDKERADFKKEQVRMLDSLMNK
jgi:hypothetical protein